MNILLDVFLLVAGFVLLIKGADFFVEGASSVASKLHIPPLVIGLTIVAFGTSAPEAAISITAGLQGNAGIAVGNVLGSNIMNVLLILGVTAAIAPLTLQRSTARVEIPFTIFVTVLLAWMGIAFGELSWVAGLILWGLFLAFLVYLILLTRQNKAQETVAKPVTDPNWKLILMIIGGMAAIVLGSDLTVDSATAIAQMMGVSDRLIGLTIVAFGTSLPELITSVTAARKGSTDIAVGNIIGSNLFNILFVLSTTALITPVAYGSAFQIDSLVAIASVVLLFLLTIKTGKLTRKGGIAMLCGYAAYFVYLCV